MVRTASSLTFEARRHFLGTAIVTCALCVLSHGVSAQVIYVPGDYDDLQEAIDAAPPDATIVTYGTWISIRITKPLTLIGGSYEADCSSTFIELAGLGHGKVVLSNITSAGYVCGPCAPNPGSGISGGGFDELAIYDSTIYAPFVIPCGGRAFGTPAVSTNIPFVVLERCLLVGSRTDDSELTGHGSPGPPGIHAPGSTVLALDSYVQGGDSGWFTTHPDYGYLCDDFLYGSGRGGPGIAAATLYHSGSTLVGGVGAIFDAYLYEGGPYGRCPCRSPDGVPVVSGARATELPKDLKIRSNFSIGSTIELSYERPGPGALLFSFGLAQPRIFPRDSLLFLQAPQYPVGVIAGQFTIPVPRLRSLIGRQVAFQVFNRLLGATRPVGGVFR